MLFQLSSLFFLAFFASFVLTETALAASCIGNLAELDALQTARGNNVSTHVTYILCPNTVYLPTDFEYLLLNGNATYLCGEDGSSANNCIIRGGYIQVAIFLYAYDRAPKDNILVSGFTFEDNPFNNLVVAMNGRSTFRDCIFKDNDNYGVLSLAFGFAPTLRRTRQLTSSSDDKLNLVEEYIQFRKSSDEHSHEMERSLMVGGQPRQTVVFDKCEFRNSTLTTDEEFKFLAQNGILTVLSHQTDVTLTDCLFKDNRFRTRTDGPGYGYLVITEAGSTLNIQNSCFIDNFVENGAPVWVRCASGLIDSANNYIDDIPYGTDCQYMFNQEQYKCFAHESPYCPLPACKASYQIFNARSDRFFANIVNGGTITNPPCSINIEAILPCASKGVKAKVQLLQGSTVIKELVDTDRFFLFGNNKNNILPGTIASGTYKIRTKINGIVQPAPFTFTLAGTCVP